MIVAGIIVALIVYKMKTKAVTATVPEDSANIKEASNSSKVNISSVIKVEVVEA